MCELLRLNGLNAGNVSKVSKLGYYSPVVLLIQKRNYSSSLLLLKPKKETYYERLGVKKNATKDEIKQAYIRKSKEHHPDKVFGVKGGVKGDDTMKELNEAYNTLRNTKEKEKYDQQLNTVKPTQNRNYNAQQYSQPNSQYQRSYNQQQRHFDQETARRAHERFNRQYSQYERNHQNQWEKYYAKQEEFRKKQEDNLKEMFSLYVKEGALPLLITLLLIYSFESYLLSPQPIPDSPDEIVKHVQARQKQIYLERLYLQANYDYQNKIYRMNNYYNDRRGRF